MNETLFEDIEDALKARTEWEGKQEGSYLLRYGGIKRTNKPYPNAPDMHYPLADSDIDKLKPLFTQQLYSNDTLASFISTQAQSPVDTTSAGEWFDYQMKQKTNFEREIMSAIDQVLECGFIVVKAYYNSRKDAICFSTCDNNFIVVPQGTEELQDTDWFVQMLHLSERKYKSNTRLDQDRDLVKRIKGKGGRDEGGNVTAKMQSVELREGINCGRNDNEIVLWEIYRKSGPGKDAKWIVETISPIEGWETAIRAPFTLPYDHGQLPFFKIRLEITKKGWYAPRGIPELVAPYQMALKKLWDQSLQFLDFFGTPAYTNKSQSQIPNAANFQQSPGGILPPGIEPVSSPSAPIDFDRQMNMTRAIAEDRIAIPDLGASEHLNGGQSAGGKGVTATQVNAIVGISSQSNDLRSRVFRLDLAEGYQMAWSLFLQYKKTELEYILGDDLKSLTANALHDKYVIRPSGSADSWNTQQQFQKAVARFQLLRGDPFINQAELRKDLLAADQASLVKRLFQDPGAELKKQGEQQAQELSIMLLGYPAAVEEADDDPTHVQTLVQFIERRMGQQEQITPELARLALQHGAAHIEGATKKKNPALPEMIQKSMHVVQLLQQIASQPDPQPSNVMQMQQPGMVPSTSSGPGLAGGAPAAAPPADPSQGNKDAVAMGNMLANMVRSGVPISHGDINTVLRKLGLPDLPVEQIQTPVPTPHDVPAENNG